MVSRFHFRWGFSSVLAVILLGLGCLVACQSPKDIARTAAELKFLNDRVSQKPPRYDFTDFSLLDGVSEDTLIFLSQDFSRDEENSVTEEYKRKLRDFKSHLSGSWLSVIPANLSDIPMAKVDSAVRENLSHQLGDLRQRHLRVWGDGVHYDEVFCEDECECIARHLGEDLQSRHPEVSVLYLRIVGGRHGFVVAYSGSARSEVTWDHHEVTLIGDRQGGWSVVDPVVYGDTGLHSLSEWYTRFAHDEPSSYIVGVKAPKFMMDR